MSPSPQPPTPRTAVFICGATGSQGGSLAHHLRSKLDWQVRTTVRNPDSPAARDLVAAGVQVSQGDWDDTSPSGTAALSAAMAGCTKLFLCLLPDFSDMTREPRQAAHILSAAKAAGITQVVASTSLGVFTLEHEPDVLEGGIMAAHLANKAAVEDAVRNGGFASWTLLRPSFFMANFLEPKVERYPEPRDRGTWTTALTAETPLGLVDHVDIAAYAAAALQDPESFHRRAVGLASELLTVQETLDLLGRAVPGGRPMKAVFMTDEEVAERQKTSHVFTNSQVSMRHAFRYIDMEGIRSVIRTTSFRDFLEREKEGVRRTYSK